MILDGIGSKFSRIISSVVCFVAAYITGFVLCWDLTLILLASFPLMMLCGIFITKVNEFKLIIHKLKSQNRSNFALLVPSVLNKFKTTG